jgi:hypothetical protein
LFDEKLTERNVSGRVHGVGVQTATRGVEVRKLGEEAEVGILEEVFNGHDIGEAGFVDVRKELSIVVEGAVGAIIFAPTNAFAIEDLEDAGNINVGGEIGIVEALACRGACKGAEAVRVGGLL